MLALFVDFLKKIYKENLLAIILFGSYVFSKKYNDIDILVIVRKRKFGDAFEEGVKLIKEFGKEEPLDVKVLTLEEFKENLVPGSFLSGLALGYKILYDKIDVEKMIKEFFKKLAEHNYEIVRKGIKINLSKLAKTYIII